MDEIQEPDTRTCKLFHLFADFCRFFSIIKKKMYTLTVKPIHYLHYSISIIILNNNLVIIPVNK